MKYNQDLSEIVVEDNEILSDNEFREIRKVIKHDDTVLEIQNTFKQYTSSSGLCICENLDSINLGNFLDYLLE
jgi:hypothetical protein